MEIVIRTADPGEPGLRELLERHLEHAARHSPRESIHALDLEGLRAPDITFRGAWVDGQPAACGALRELDPGHGEIKSMHTAQVWRGRGVGARMLAHLLEEARARGYRRVSLETGTMEGFAPARALYHRFGFRECPPFATYREDRHSLCMTLELEP